MIPLDDSEARNLKLVRQHYTAFSSGDIDGIVAGLSRSVAIVVHDEHGLPEERIRGRNEARRFFEGIRADVTNSVVDLQEVRADGDRVLATIEIGGTLRKSGMTGAIPAVHLFTFHEGLITRIHTHRPNWRQYADDPG